MGRSVSNRGDIQNSYTSNKKKKNKNEYCDNRVL